jgi:hypothetical protein
VLQFDLSEVGKSLSLRVRPRNHLASGFVWMAGELPPTAGLRPVRAFTLITSWV